MIEKINHPNNLTNIGDEYTNPYMFDSASVDKIITADDCTAQDLKGGYAIQDKHITLELVDYMKSTYWDNFFINDGKHNIQEEYKETFRNWITSSKLNKISGLEQFPFATITNGTSEAFQMFFMRHNNRRFKFIKGDFIMHKVASNIMDLDWDWMANFNDLEYGDAVIISCPFSDTASKYMYLDDMLRFCTEKDIPVLLDMAYYGTCLNLNIDLNEYPCVEDVTFSLGKAFPIIGARAGIRFQREETDDPVLFANQNGIVNNFACRIGNHCMLNFSADYIPYKYYDSYYALCVHGDLGTTNCVIFATSDDEKYDSINRGNELTRLCVSDLVLKNYERLTETK